MDNTDTMYNLLGFISPIIAFFLLKVMNYRAEGVVCEFLVPLRKKYPRSYVNQIKIIKWVRKLSNMTVEGKIHWMHCLGSCLQLITLVEFVVLIFLLLFGVNIEASKIMYFHLLGCAIWGLIRGFFTVILCFKCKKIKKNDPMYSECELRNYKL